LVGNRSSKFTQLEFKIWKYHKIIDSSIRTEATKAKIFNYRESEKLVKISAFFIDATTTRNQNSNEFEFENGRGKGLNFVIYLFRILTRMDIFP